MFRKRVNHKSRKDIQLDLFNPDDGSWEYSVVATNKRIGLTALWPALFTSKRVEHEKRRKLEDTKETIRRCAAWLSCLRAFVFMNNPGWHFANGRGVQEKTYGELKGEYAFASIPTNHYGANTAWQKLNVITHNLVTSFQLETTAKAKPHTRKRTAFYGHDG